MADFKLHSRVRELTLTEGTGTYSLAGATDGYQSAAAAGMATGDTSFWYITTLPASGDWEIILGTYNAAGTVARTGIIDSSNGGNAVSWLPGRKVIAMGLPAPGDLDFERRTLLAKAMGYGAGYRNVLHNGGFQIAQRGDGPFTSASTFVNNDDAYLLDGCIFLANGADTCDVSRVADTDFASGYKIRLDVETANRRFGIFLPVEASVARAIIKSGKASVQFKCKRTGSTLVNVRAYFLTWSGTADAITSDVISAWNAAGADPTFVASWTAENAGANLAVGTTIATHTIENIVVDTGSGKNIGLLIISDPTTTTVGHLLELGDIQVEEGPICTPYEHRHVAIDEALCQRYFFYRDLPYNNDIFIGSIQSTTTPIGQQNFPVTMRAAPSCVVSGLSYNLNGSPVNMASPTVSVVTKHHMNMYGTVAGLTQGQAVRISGNSAGTSYLWASAEL